MMKTVLNLIPKKITIATPHYGLATITLNDGKGPDAVKQQDKQPVKGVCMSQLVEC